MGEADTSIPENNISKEAAVTRASPVVVAFAGALAGGHNVDQYTTSLNDQFGKENVMVIPSASTKYAFTEGNLTPSSFQDKSYYKHLAEQALVKLEDRDHLIVHCHSGGGIEGVAFLTALLTKDNLQTKKIDFVFSGVPGLAEKSTHNMGRLWEFWTRFRSVLKNQSVNQHFDLYPPPEKYYESTGKTDNSIENVEVAYDDNLQTRDERRKRFEDHYMAHLEPRQKEKILAQLEVIDNILISALNEGDNKTVQAKIKDRAKIVFQIGGVDYYKKKEDEPQFKTIKHPGPAFYTVGMLYFQRLLASVATGMEKNIQGVVKQAKTKGIALRVSFAILENDPVFGLSDIQTAKTKLKVLNEEELLSWLLVEGLSHESVDNSPQGILAALQRVAESRAS